MKTRPTLLLTCCLAPLNAACSADKGGEDTGEHAGGADADCSVVSAEDIGLAIEPTKVPTAPMARWTLDEPASTWLQYTSDGALRSTPVVMAEAGDQEQSLLGLTAHTDVDVQVFVDDGITTWCSQPVHAVTGGLDPDLPEFSMENILPDRTEAGYLAVPLFGEKGSQIAVIDTARGYVWATPTDPSVRRVRKALSRTSLVMNLEAADTDMEGRIVELAMDGAMVEEHRVVGAHTDFVETDPGTYVAIAWDPQTPEGRDHEVLGDQLVEISPAGTSRVLWRAWDALDFDEDIAHPTVYYPGGVMREEWTHANGLSYDSERGTLLLTLGAEHAVVAIDRASGATRWVLGGPSSDFELDAGVLSLPHSAVLLPDGNLLVFNRNEPGSDCSEAVEISLDPNTGVAEEVWAYQGEECLSVYFLGQADPLDGGNRLVIFSTSGRVDQATPTGETTWSLTFDLGVGVGFGELIDDLY